MWAWECFPPLGGIPPLGDGNPPLYWQCLLWLVFIPIYGRGKFFFFLSISCLLARPSVVVLPGLCDLFSCHLLCSGLRDLFFRQLLCSGRCDLCCRQLLCSDRVVCFSASYYVTFLLICCCGDDGGGGGGGLCSTLSFDDGAHTWEESLFAPRSGNSRRKEAICCV